MKTFYKFLLIPMLATFSFTGFAQLNVTITGYYPVICSGSYVHFTGLVNGGTVPYHYQWSPSHWLSSDTIYNPICHPSNSIHDTTIMYNVIVTDSVGAKDTAMVNIFFPKEPTLWPITSTAPNNTICNGMSTTITAPSDGSYTYLWQPGNLSGNPITVSPTSNTCWNVTISNYGCTGTNMFCILVNNCSYNIIHSTVFNDINNNGTRDAGEYRMANIMPKITPAASVLSYTYDTSLTAYVGTGSFNVAPVSTPYYTQTTNPTITFTGFTSDVTQDIGLYGPPGIKDIKVDIIPYYYTNYCGGCITLYWWGWPYSGGGIGSYTIQYTNAGTDTLNGVLKIKYDAQMNSFGAFPYQSTINNDSTLSIINDTLIWQYHNLLPGESRYINAGGQITNPVIGNTLQVSVIGYPILGDSDPTNNYDTCYQLITGSWDPNFKEVDHDSVTLPQIMAGIPLTYTIHFQNTGNDTAIFVKVRDIISPKLNMASFEMISSSHPYILTDTTGNVIQWKFNNIMLPDSGANQLLSNGFVKYRITPLTGLSDGDSIENLASIYFDNNAQVATNKATTYIEKIITSVNEHNSGSPLSLSPNPTNGPVNIRLPQQFGKVITLGLYNVMGQLQQVLINVNSIDLSGFSAGLYFVVLRNEKGEVMRGKVVKE